MQIIRILKESILAQREYDFALKKESAEWDGLSDEAMLKFENAL